MKYTYHKITNYEAKGPIKKVLLLYSGGLDTSTMIKWIQEKYKTELYTLTLNIGQIDENFDEIKAKALKLGVKKAIVLDAQKEFANFYISKAIKANADYEGGYHLFCPLGRALISKKAVEIAKKEKISVIAHGATGKGNDQVRFDTYITTLDPSIKILAPVREWALTRNEQIAYAKKHNIPLKDHSKLYSYDQNLWGISAEGGDIENIKLVPDLKKILIKNELPEKTFNEPAFITIEFEEGLPIKLNGHELDLVNTIKALSSLGAVHGIGTLHFIEDRIIGLKIRGIYEQPAAEIIIKAHKELEKAVSTKEELEFKKTVDNKWADLCYSAKWHEPLMANLNSFIDSHNKKVSGKVKCMIFKGQVHVISIDSEYSLVDSVLSSFDSYGFNQQASAAFIEHYSLQQKTAYKLVNNKL